MGTTTRTASDNIKGQLHVDELDSGMQKVQQLDVLGAG